MFNYIIYINQNIMEIQTYPWESMEIHGNPWMFKDVHGYPRALVFCQGRFYCLGLAGFVLNSGSLRSLSQQDILRIQRPILTGGHF